MKKILNFINVLNEKEKYKRIKRNITLVLSIFVTFMTLYILMNLAFTLGDYKLQLNDNYITDAYSWKTENGYSTSFNLNLNFVDLDGVTIDGNNIIINIDELVPEVGYTFGSTNKSELINILNENELEVILVDNGKYTFEYAEVLVDGLWQRLVLDENIESKIWCKNCFSQKEPEDKDYGWRGSYGTDNVEYIINENTEFNLYYSFEANEVVKSVEDEAVIEPTTVVDRPMLSYTPSVLTTARSLSDDRSVASLGSESGITFKLYNYTGTNAEEGINNNGLFSYFAFKDSHRPEGPGVEDTDTDQDGFLENRTKVFPILDATKNPVFNCKGKCAGAVNTSLGYLFGNNTNANGTATQGVTSYNPSNTILQKEADANGVNYYYYDSNRNAVDYDIDNSRFIVRDYIERGYLMTTFAGESGRGEFLPFNYLASASNPNDTYHYESADNLQEIDHWFGMTMEFEFYMPQNGLINGQPMDFLFSGDDDVWVFIDDVLVLDLGGTHGAVDGSINFHTGAVSSNLNWQGVTEPAYSTSISQMYTNAGVALEANAAGTTYADYSKHTLKFFYLERGAWVANCKIRFNIPVLSAGSLTIEKNFEGTEKYADNYKFAVYDATTNLPVPVGTKYSIGDTEYAINNSNGEFTLTNNQVAVFLSKTEVDDPNGNYLRSNKQYYVKEVDAGIHADSYSCELNDVSCTVVNQTPAFTMTPNLIHSVVFKNKTKTYNLNISKEAINSYEGELFNFQLTFKDENGNIVNANNFGITAPHGYTINQSNNGIVNFQLETAQNISVTGIPYGTVIDVQELNHDGYHASIKAIEGGTEVPLVQGDLYTINMITENKDIKVYNTPGVVLPETGGIGTLIYIVVGLGMVIASTILSIAYFRSAKVGDE